MLEQITPLILTFNEEANIARTLSALHWAKRIVVVDSYSDDATRTICAQYPNVEFVQRAFDQHATQWNFGLDHINKQLADLQRSEHTLADHWVLALDADHIVSPEYVAEVSAWFAAAREDSLNRHDTVGFKNGFIYCQDGTPLRGSLYPPLIALFKASRGHYVQDGHTQRLILPGTIVQLKSCNWHDDRKPFARWFVAQQRYARLDAAKLASRPFNALRWTDRARIIPFVSPLLVLFYTLVYKRLLFSGWPGIKYSALRTVAESLLHTARCKRWLGLS